RRALAMQPRHGGCSAHWFAFLSHAPQRRAASDEVLEELLAPYLVLQIELLLRQLRVDLLDAFVRERVSDGDRDLSRDARQQPELVRRERVWRKRREVERAEGPVRRDQRHGTDGGPAEGEHRPAFGKSG